MPKTLTSFSISQAADGYVLHLEDDDGDTTEFGATEDQLDEIMAAIEEQLDMDDADDLAEEEDDELPLDEE